MDEIILFIIIFVSGILLGGVFFYFVFQTMNKAKLLMWKTREEKRIRKDTAKAMRGTIKGKISEQVSPILEKFPGSIADARFLGSPIDFVVFDGYAQNNIDRIVFVEVKTGEKANLTTVERQVRKCIKQKKVDWVEYQVSQK
jgi:predicted Holliday junction resolvase-like endonuclease